MTAPHPTEGHRTDGAGHRTPAPDDPGDRAQVDPGDRAHGDPAGDRAPDDPGDRAHGDRAGDRAHGDPAGDRADGPGRLTVLSGPSGVGKSTVVRRLLARCPQVWLSVSATTRAPRPGEVDDVDYVFVSREEFDAMVADDALLEWAEFAGNRYGTPRRPVEERLASGQDVLLEIELHGARQVKAAMPEARAVFLAPPSWDQLVARLVGRGTEGADVVARRLDQARVELAAEKEFDATVVNASVEQAVEQLVTLLGLEG